MSKNSARHHDPRQLARELVDYQYDNTHDSLSSFLGLDGELIGLEAKFEAIVAALLRRNYSQPVRAQVEAAAAAERSQPDGSAVIRTTQQVWADAGLLVGMEIGRRLGGVR